MQLILLSGKISLKLKDEQYLTITSSGLSTDNLQTKFETVSGNITDAYKAADTELSGLLTSYIDDKVSGKLDISEFKSVSSQFVLTSQIIEDFNGISNDITKPIPTTNAVSTFVDTKIKNITPIIAGADVDEFVNYNRIIINDQTLSFIPSGTTDKIDLSKSVTSSSAEIENAINDPDKIPTVSAVQQFYTGKISALTRTN
jgi:hypothetical protein